MANPTFFKDGHTPNQADTSWRVLQKILGATVDGSGGNQTGANDPVTAGSAGQTYTNTTTNTFWYWNTTSSSWVQIV